MRGFHISTYGDAIADLYDEFDWAGNPGDTDECVRFLAGCAGDGPVLELGVGTGRVAVPLAAKGVEVHGIDSSAAMLDKLRAKPGGERVRATVGDFSEIPMTGPYALAYVVFDTLHLLTEQEAQVRCFEQVARVLRPGGRFVVQCSVPDPSRYDRGQRTQTMHVEKDHALLTFTRQEKIAQRTSTQFALLSENGIRLFPLHMRSITPAEMDLMARIAGLRRESRASDWAGSPLADDSIEHVTVYRK